MQDTDATIPAPTRLAIDVSPPPLENDAFDARYETRSLLGKGGMGEVYLFHDRRIGREVALKSIREGLGSRAAAARARFLREARVQGQLEHPAIVPVYDLGVGPDGEAYFTMKRVRGLTLADVVEGLRANNPELQRKY